MTVEEKITFESEPVWFDRYEEERERIRNHAKDGLLGIFHVGSTAIPDLAGKTVLDVIAVFTDYESMRAAADTLVGGNYELGFDKPDYIVLTREGDDYAVFVKIHTQDDQKVRNQLIFREYLRENPEARQEYERVKRKAASEHLQDQETYNKAKSKAIKILMRQAHRRGYAEDLPEFA